jgi:hypothetical protein
MDGIRPFNPEEAIGKNLSLEKARATAKSHSGNEAIVKDQDGTFSVYSLNKNDSDNISKKNYSSYESSVAEFSIMAKGGDKILDRVSTEKFKTKDQAENAAKLHSGSEALVRNDDLTFSLQPLDELQLKNVESRNFKGTSAKVYEFVVEKSPESNLIVEPITLSGEKIVENAKELLKNIDSNKGKHNEYVLGGGDSDSVSISKGISETDCSGFVRAMASKVGVDLNDQNAAGIGKMIRNGKGPLKRVERGGDIKPGDILTFALPSRSDISGHAMIAISEPTPIYNKKQQIVGYNIRIADSTSRPHGDDKNRKTGDGAGSGLISIGVDPKTDKIKSLSWQDNFKGYDYKQEVSVGRFKE